MARARLFLPVAILAVAVVLLQLILHLAGGTYLLTQLTMAAYYSIVVVGLCLLMGFAGQISLGHAGFFAIGGYLSAFLATMDLSGASARPLVKLLTQAHLLVQRQDLYGATFLSVAPWIAFIVAVLVGGAVALLIGMPVLRLRGHYLAMATLGFGLIVYRVLIATPAFGEADGISDVPAFTLIPGVSVNGRLSMRVENYYIAWVAVIISVILALNLVHSRIGRALRSIHANEEAARALGIDASRLKLATFVFSAVLAAAAGSLLTSYNGGIGPSEAGTMKSIRYVAIVAVGGMANIWGALISGMILNFLSLRGVFGTYDDAVFAGILILVMLFAPQGILHLRIFRLPRRLPWRRR